MGSALCTFEIVDRAHRASSPLPSARTHLFLWIMCVLCPIFWLRIVNFLLFLAFLAITAGGRQVERVFPHPDGKTLVREGE